MRNLLSNAAIAVASLAMASGIVAFADPANANVPDTVLNRVVVQTNDLNLNSAAGLTIAKHRIRNAADRACAFDGNLLSASGHCRDEAVRAANQALQDRIAAL